MEKWVRGAMIGRGSFGTVNLAIGIRKSNPQTPLLMAVKSAPLPLSSSLQNERQVLAELQDCPQILRCLGHDIAADDDGRLLYNLFLEYASGGSLAHLGKLPESSARRHTASILRGLGHIHQNGFVHCDIKLRNILLCSEEVKIADFGLAKKAGEKAEEGGVYLRGTPLYMAPESVARNEYEPPSDIWALGCAVLEMVTGKPAWRCPGDAADVSALLFQIALGDELPEVSWELSEECRDFLSRCFVRDPSKRWSAEMLLQHPFVSKGGDETVSGAVNSRPSPRSVFDLMAWDLPQPSSFLDSFAESECEGECIPIGISSPVDRIAQLAAATTGKCPDWSDSEGDCWITVRKAESSVSQPEEIQDLGCSVSPSRDSLLELEEMVLIERKGDENSDSDSSTSYAAIDENLSSGFNVSDCNTCFWCGRGEFGCRKRRRIPSCMEEDQFQKTNIHGSGFFPFFSWENRDCDCNFSSTSDEYKHKNIY